ncbi:MAG: TolC family protein [Planctomycetia bacterium]|nr:TolC family protein [Planctomycetia bacterium]
MIHRPRLFLAVLLLAVTAWGCAQRCKYEFFEGGDLSFYEGVATQIEHPLVADECLEHPEAPPQPITLESFEAQESWDLSLEEAVQTALANSKVIRQVGPSALAGAQAARGQPPDTLLSQPESLPTIYDSAIQETNVVGATGVEAALASFDAQLSASMFWDRRERPINLGGFGNLIFARDSQQDLGTFQAELSKTTGIGARYYLQHNAGYEFSNSPTRGVASDYEIDYIAGVELPLLQGAGAKFNQIAGPSGAPGVYGGVLIARINEDIELAEFETAVRNQLRDVEDQYWGLYAAYRALDAAREGRDSAYRDWEDFKKRQQREGGWKVEEAQARSDLADFEIQVQDAVRNILGTENRLRYLMGVPATDGRIIRPTDQPTLARVHFDWEAIHLEGIARSPELRKQRWRINQRDLELIAAKNFLLPRLDAVALYRWLGAGDDLIDPNGAGVPPFLGSDAYSTLTSGDYQDWQLGFRLNMPLGFRRELSAVRNAQLMLARERVRLHDQEMEVSQQLTHAIRTLDFDYQLMLSRYNKLVAANDELDALTRIQKSGARVPAGGRPEVLYSDVVRARADRTAAEADFHSAVVSYNIAIRDVHFRKGSLLEYSGVYLAEGPWPAEAYADAHRLAAARGRGPQLNYAMSRHVQQCPGPISLGPEAGPPSPEPLPPLEQIPPGTEEMTPPAPPTPADANAPAEKSQPTEPRSQEGAPAEKPPREAKPTESPPESPSVDEDAGSLLPPIRTAGARRR